MRRLVDYLGRSNVIPGALVKNGDRKVKIKESFKDVVLVVRKTEEEPLVKE